MRLILLVMLLTLVCSTEVDNLNVLLPELKLATPILPLQLITAQGGCYHWTSSAPDILSVTANDSIAGSCSRQAVIQIAEVGPFYSSIFVTATDVNTQAILNIPVRIRKINKIVIVTKSRMMNIKEIQKIELFAYDADENTFTSLQGLRFKWILEQASQIIQSVPLSHAQLYLPLKTRQHMEKIGLQSDILVVQALAPGNLKIIVKCVQPGYQNLHDQITLSVHERFQLQPGPRIWIAPGSSIQLSLVRTTQQQISLPQSYYNIVSCPGFSINSSLYLTGSTKPSVCTIKVEDTRTRPSYVSSVQIIVENPDQIRIIADSIMIVGTQQPYTIELLRKNVVLRGITNKLKVSSDFTINPSLQTVLPQKKMIGSIKATFQNLIQQIKINALLPVQAVIPGASLHLPVDEHFKLKMVGGSGYYEYFVNNQIASVTSQGVIICKLPGSANITISDRNHPSNKAVIKLMISSIAFIQDLESVKEVNRDQWGLFYIIAKNHESQTFTQCLQSTFQVSLPSTKLDIDKKNSFGDQIKKLTNNTATLVKQTIAETSLLKGRQQYIIDNYKIYVKFGELQTEELKDYIYNLQNYGICSIIKYKSQIGLEEKVKLSLVGNQQIKTQLNFRVYEPLVNNIQDGNASFLLTPLSSLTWNFTGGSYPWPATSTRVTLNEVKVLDGHFPVIICPDKQTISMDYNLHISNQQTKALLFPTYQHSTIKVACKFPKKMQLILEYGMVFEQIFIYKNSNILGWVQPLDEQNKRFYNASNVQYSLVARKGIIQGVDNNFSYLAKEGSDLIKISCQKLKKANYFPKIQVSLSINVVDPIIIDHLLFANSRFNVSDVKKTITIVTPFTPKKPYILNLKHSSPLLNVQCTQAVACERGEHSVIVKLLGLGRGKVVLRDKKIYGNSQWQFDFVIVEIDQIVVSGERNYIQEGESVNISISQYYQNTLISPLLYEINSLQLIINRNLRVIEQEANRFVVRAEKEGNYSIHGEQAFPAVIRSKNPFNLYVYRKIEANIIGSVLKKQGNVLIIEGTILIASGCRRTLAIAGGPSDQRISYQAESGVDVNANSPTTYSITGIKEGTYFISFTSSFLNHTIAKINIKAIVSNIEAIELSSIDQPVINAQFRVLPTIRIGELQIEECSCNFQYKWSVENEFLRLGKSTSLGFLSARGINATALVAGSEVISLQVIDRKSQRIIGKASKYIQILTAIDFKMPTLIEAPYSSSSSLLLPPLTSYAFPKDYALETVNGIIKIGLQNNIVQSGKKTGQSSLQITKSGYKTELLQVQVLPISGIFIQNQNGFVTMQPYSELQIPLYFQDRYGRLFITPLINFQPIITSSNYKILEASLSSDGKYLHLLSRGEGICLLTVKVTGKNIQDAIAVSIGSQIKPSSSVRVLKNGIVKYSLANQQDTKWRTSNKQIAQIDSNTGLLHAKQLGRCKIENGQLSGQIIVSEIAKVQEIIVSAFDGKELSVIYRFLWLGTNGLEELPHFKSHDSIDNNFKPHCHSKKEDLFETVSQIVQSQGYQRLLCKIRIAHSTQMTKMQNQFEIIISDSDEKQIKKFKYSFTPHFMFDTSKSYISLSGQKPKEQIQIQTLSAVQITQTNGLKSWVKSSFDEDKNIQTIIVDMSGQKSDWNWQLLLESGQQRQIIKIAFSSSGQSSQNHSFWSLSLDWPDYLIILMGVIFAVVCFLQYVNEQKIKSQ